MSECVLYDVRSGAAWITLNRPEQRNALSADLVNTLYAHLEAANADPDVRLIVLTGAGPAFCSGADLKSPPGSVAGAAGRSYGLPDILRRMLEGKPVICAINGSAFAGGLGLVGASDIVITREDAAFSFSEVRIGVIPAIISVVCIPKLGPHHAMRLFLTGERFSGQDAVTYGLAHKAVPADGLMAAVEAELAMLRLGGPQALQGCKDLVRRVPGWSLEEGFAQTAPLSVRFFRSEEASEGMAAFREKRQPRWTEAAGPADKA
jgi:methylglutaconyl-CoA hydratase